LITTSVVRGSQQGESHGGIYLVNFAQESVDQVVDWNTSEIEFSGRGWDRGLRGIAFFAGEIYIAASDELFVYDQDHGLSVIWMPSTTSPSTSTWRLTSEVVDSRLKVSSAEIEKSSL